MPGAKVGDAQLPREPAPRLDASEFNLVSPVEIWFGETRVGVKRGTKTFDLFQRYASCLLEDLSKARRLS